LATTGRGDHEVHKGHVVALKKKHNFDVILKISKFEIEVDVKIKNEDCCVGYCRSHYALTTTAANN
jgi:hypothetical protein